MKYTVRSEEELNDLKTDWLNDPCWDIEETEGFEVWHDDLLAWRQEIEAEAALNESQRIGYKTAALGISATLLRYIERLESRIDQLEQKIEALS